MPDNESVKEWLQDMTNGEAEWCAHYSDVDCQRLAKAALNLLKKQEAVEPILSYGTFRCGNCGNIVGYNDGYGRGYQNNFCSDCGWKVKWDA